MIKNFYILIKIFFLICFLSTNVLADKSKSFDKGKKLFEKNNYEKSKFYFEKELVFDPLHEYSYLYLAKIFNKNENEDEEEKNLDSVLLLNPQNEEAVYMLTLLKIKQSNYNAAKDLIETFDLVCESFCNKKNEITKKFNELHPENDNQ